MRLFIYYAVHSFLNTLKKLLKTWVAVFLVIGLGGALIGGIIRKRRPRKTIKRRRTKMDSSCISRLAKGCPAR